MHNVWSTAKRLKAAHPDAVLLIQLDPRSDYYDAFEEDALTVMDVCDTVLWSEPYGPTRTAIPAFRISAAIEQLVAAGHRVAVAEPEK